MAMNENVGYRKISLSNEIFILKFKNIKIVKLYIYIVIIKVKISSEELQK